METPLPKSPPLTKVSEPRWKWMALSGAAVGAASASSALAGTVQITQVNNQISTAATSLNPDLTGDGVSDLVGLNGVVGKHTYTTSSKWFYQNRAFISAANPRFNNGVAVSFVRVGKFTTGPGKVIGSGATNTSFMADHWYDIDPANKFKAGATPQDNSGLTPVVFTDSRINGGRPTNGLLETRAFSTSGTDHTIRIVRLVFDDARVTRPAGVVKGETVREFNPAVYALRAESKALKAKVFVFAIILKKVKVSKAKEKKMKRFIRKANARIAVLAGQI